jgi:hypothetical protein
MGNVCCGGKAEGTKSSAFITSNNNVTNHDVVDRNDSGFDIQQHSNVNSILSNDRKNASGNDASSINAFPNNNNNNNNINSTLQQFNQNNTTTGNKFAVDNDQYMALREEQARLEMIVQSTGRGMVSIRSTRGNTGYYDQGFAAALWQHLEHNKTSILQTATSPMKTRKLPSPMISSISDQPTNGSSSISNKLPDVHSSQTTVVVDNTSSSKQNDAKSSSDLIYGILSQPMWENINLVDNNKQPSLLLIDQIAESYFDAISPNQENLFTNSGPIVESLL